MANAREETVRYFVEQFQLMLGENLDDYIKNFESYRATWPQPANEPIN
jgi:hypothetical protein